ncbi:MAG: 3-hydroxyacyl-CoA dehydrogenase family protein [Metallosphaera prunae]|nr:3-hydroxyacyl-CoA dehydrogenase family protein [Metallosphaera prunae]MCY0862424.1 3-hydroxyacyl-CoA dehydrogenase family protein [Metallosphaera prunae]
MNSRGYEAYSPNPLLVKMVSQGQTGKSSGRGFYTYGKT